MTTSSEPSQASGHLARVRVVVQQPALPKYRVPVFHELSCRANFDLTLYYDITEGGPPSIENVEFPAHAVSHSSDWLIQRALNWNKSQWKLASRKHADVLILTWNIRYSSLIPALIKARLQGVKTILWGHGYSKNGSRWHDWMRYQVGRLATALMFYSQRVAKDYCQRGTDPRRVFVATNSLDQQPIIQAKEAWLSDSCRLNHFRKSNDLQGPVLLYVSRLLKENHIELLIEAGARLKNQHPTLKIVIIGSGAHEGSLQQLSRDLDMSSHVLFLGSIYEESELAPWFLTSDICCYPAHIGLSILHAFGYGLPVVTNNKKITHGPEIEALRDQENGCLYEYDNLDDMVRVIDDLISSPDKRQAMSQAALHTAEKEYTLPKMVDGIEAAIQYCAEKLDKKQSQETREKIESRVL